MAIEQAPTATAEELAHFGVLGMHWGQRHAQKNAEKADKKWTKKASSKKHILAAQNAAAHRMNNGELQKFNNQPKYKNADFSKDSPLRRQYYSDYDKLFAKVVDEESTKLLGPRPKLKHADEDDVPVRLVKDARGRIISVEILEPEDVEHSDDLDYLEHYGIKGMRWGVIREHIGKGKQYIESSDDHKRAGAVRTKAKIAGVNALSNKDLNELITRMNLEVQYKNLKSVEHNQSLVGKGKLWVGHFLTRVGGDIVTNVATSWLKRPGSRGGRTSHQNPSHARAWVGDQPSIPGNYTQKAIGS